MASELWDNLRFQIKTWWENWPARKWINDNPRTVIKIAAGSFGLFVLVLVWIVWPSGEGAYRRPDKAWYYDVGTDTLFLGDAELGSPVAAPSEKKTAYRARLLAYAAEPNEDEQFIGFLEMTDANTIGRNDERPRVLVRTIEDANWYAADSVKGRNIVQGAVVPNSRGMLPHPVEPVNKIEPRDARAR